MTNKTKIRIVCFLIGVFITLSFGYIQYEKGVRGKGFESMDLVLTTERAVITDLILTHFDLYVNLEDLVMDFKPKTKDESALKIEVLEKLKSCLIDAKDITKGKQTTTPLTKEKITL